VTVPTATIIEALEHPQLWRKWLGDDIFPSKTSSEIFIDTLPLLMSGKIELLDNPTLVNQLASLERKVGRGRDHIAAAGSGHDDVALACCGALVRAAKTEAEIGFVEIYVADNQSHPVPDRWRPNWIDGPIPLPFGGGYAKDEYIGTSDWTRRKLNGEF
jgi:hypothetical protein